MVIIILLIDLYLVYKIAKNNFISKEIEEIKEEKICVGEFGFTSSQKVGYYIMVIVFSMFSFLFLYLGSQTYNLKTMCDVIAIITMLIPWISVEAQLFFMKRQYIVLINNRIIGKYRIGILSTNIVNLTLDKITNVTIQNRIISKNILLSAGGIDKIIFLNILNSEQFKEAVNKEIDNYKNKFNSKTELNSKEKNISTADEILKLKNLLDQGILTQEEFDNKKKQLLSL